MMRVLGMKRANSQAGEKRERWRNIRPVPVLMLAIGALLVSAPVSSVAQTPPPVSGAEANSAPDPFAAFIGEASQRFNVPTLWLRAVMQVESAGYAQAKSPRGAMGLMQIMPDTYAQLRQEYGLGADPFDPHDNIMAGAAYLREMYDLYGAPGFLAAYNAGPGRYDDHLVTGQPLPEETQFYLSRLEPLIGGVQVGRIIGTPDPLTWMNAPLFIGGNTNAEIYVNPRSNKVAFYVAAHVPVPSFTGATNANVAALFSQSEGLFVSVTHGGLPQ
ncbi:transglycosylase [Acidocella aquatica]|uniref:Transglycosylase n=1 Tax=Acidocella aquatica TaxID=1922313 RepID=A0ABQ6A882_9PROT|nr:lytic transglycosylase domain-containing protein [Acidocella aquatica]GLR68680.1 transglycosylase [Acidocella aquatica]